MNRKNKRFRSARTVPPRYETNVLGLPNGAMVLTNSERRTAWCERRWWYAEGLGLGNAASRAMYFGSWVHRAMEAAFTYFMHVDEMLPEGWEDTCPLCKGDGWHFHPNIDEKCPSCLGSGDGPVKLAITMMQDVVDDWDWPEETQRLHDVITGYFQRYGGMPFQDYKVVGVEKSLAFPVISPNTNKVYRSDVYVVQDDEGWRLARSEDDGRDDLQKISMPWYQCAKLDGVLQHRKSGDLWVHEFKTSQNPQAFGRDLGLDTQIPGYMRALQYAVDRGDFGHPGQRVVGYFWDVLGSRKHGKPKVLKNGTVSLAKNQRIASWHWDEMLSTRDASSDVDEKREAMKEFRQTLAETVDPALYHREFGSFTPQSDKRYAVELYADAKRFSSMRRRVIAVGSEAQKGHADDYEASVAENFPRTPVCRIAGHGCAYTGPCLNQGMDLESVFEKRPVIKWLSAATINNPEKENEQCPEMF